MVWVNLPAVVGKDKKRIVGRASFQERTLMIELEDTEIAEVLRSALATDSVRAIFFGIDRRELGD